MTVRRKPENPAHLSVLLTGFEPFREFQINSSWEAVSRAAAELGDCVHAVRLPVDYSLAQECLYEVLQERRPEICLLTGLAAGTELRMEQCARKPSQLDSVEGPERLDGAWSWEESGVVLDPLGLPVRLSDDAGAYVCESTYWALLAFRALHGWPAAAAFLHVPPLSDDVSAELLADGVARLVRAQLGSDRGLV